MFGKKKIDKKNSTAPVSEKMSTKPLKITGGKPLTAAFLNQYFKLFSPANMLEFERLYISLEPKLKKINMDATLFMQQIRDTYSRYQQFKKIDPFSPMDKKALKYVEDYINESINKVYNMVLKK